MSCTRQSLGNKHMQEWTVDTMERLTLLEGERGSKDNSQVVKCKYHENGIASNRNEGVQKEELIFRERG